MGVKIQTLWHEINKTGLSEQKKIGSKQNNYSPDLIIKNQS